MKKQKLQWKRRINKEKKLKNKDDKEDIHPLPDDHKNIDNIPLNPPSEKNESDDHNSDKNKDE